MARRLAFKSVLDKRTGKMVDVTPAPVKALLPKRRPKVKGSTVLPDHATRPKWPMTSIRGGVHPSQVEAMNERLRAEGIVDSRFDPKTGDVTWGSHASRRKVLKVMEQHDASGYD